MTVADAEIEALLAPWDGRCGGLPPLDRATPSAIAAAYERAIVARRAEVMTISATLEAPTFDNTIAALERSGVLLRRVEPLFRVFAATRDDAEMRAVRQRLAPLAEALDDAIAHDDTLFARVEAVHRAAGLSATQRRLVDVIRDRLRRRGAGLRPEAKARLAAIAGDLARCQARFAGNLVADEEAQVAIFDRADQLAGLSDGERSAAAAAASLRGEAGRWAIPNGRGTVWPVLTRATRRDVRERVWRMWSSRGANAGEHDNRPVIAEILRLRGEQAKLLGFSDYAHLAMAGRMAATPEAALHLMEDVWSRVLGPTEALIADLQCLADGEQAGIRIAPWDRLYYAEKLRQSRFGLDAEAVRPYLALQSVIDAMFWQAGRLHGLSFAEIADAPTHHPSVRAFAVSRNDAPVGLLYLDLIGRAGKSRGSFQMELRAAQTLGEPVLPVSYICSSLEATAQGRPVLLGWEYANVLFHEFGHALHMLSSEAPSPSLGSIAVAWDLIELPALLNERWLCDRDLLRRFARHHVSGEPIPDALVDAIEQGARFDRVFSVTLDYLGSAISEMRMHLAADGGEVDALGIEHDTLAALGMPSAVDLLLPVCAAGHVFAGHYAAGLYAYLWADVMAADVAEVFMAAPGGLHDAAVAQRWRSTVLAVGNSVPADRAFRDFRGREPDAGALLRRFGLESVA